MSATRSELPVPRAGRYLIDPSQSGVQYLEDGVSGARTHTARFVVSSGEVHLTDPVEDSTATVTIDTASFTSDSAELIAEVQSAWPLGGATYPEMTFRSSSVQSHGDAWVVVGFVTAYGREIPAWLTVDRVVVKDGGIHFHGVAKGLDRSAFGTTGERGLVRRYFDLDLDVFAQLSPTPD